MAIERKVETKSAVKKAAPPKAKADKKPATPQTTDRIRADLAEARRQHAMEKLDKPHTIKRLRKDLARALTAERAKAGPKESA